MNFPYYIRLNDTLDVACGAGRGIIFSGIILTIKSPTRRICSQLIAFVHCNKCLLASEFVIPNKPLCMPDIYICVMYNIQIALSGL